MNIPLKAARLVAILATYLKLSTSNGSRGMDAATILSRQLRTGRRERNTAVWQPARPPQFEKLGIIPPEPRAVNEQPLTTGAVAIPKTVKVQKTT